LGEGTCAIAALVNPSSAVAAMARGAERAPCDQSIASIAVTPVGIRQMEHGMGIPCRFMDQLDSRVI